MSEITFINGLIVKAPNERAPDYVKAKLSIKRQELIGWLQQQPGDWVNADIKVSQSGKWYAAVDDWKPNQGNGTPRSNAPATTQRPQRATDEPRGEFVEDDIPFLSGRDRF